MANLSRHRWPPGSGTVFTSGMKNLRFHLDGGLGSAPWGFVFKLSVPNLKFDALYTDKQKNVCEQIVTFRGHLVEQAAYMQG